MVATVDDLFNTIRSNPFIDGIGYFIEITTRDSVPQRNLERLSDRMQQDFCAHSEASLEGQNVVGLDFHEHILTQGEDAEHFLTALELILRNIERDFGIEHMCIEFQFDFSRASKAQVQIDELLQP
jgi:hypothetical protein